MSKLEESSPPRSGSRAAPHLVWHFALLLSGLALLVAVWIDPEQATDEKVAAQLRIGRAGLFLVAGGLVGVWSLRAMLAGDLAAIVGRFVAAPQPVAHERLVPVLEPRAFRLAAWAGAVLWFSAIAAGLATGASWVERWTGENGVFETITVLAYLTGSVLAAVAFWPFVRDGFRAGEPRRWFLLLAAAGCFLIAAEETDWGQTYLDYRTPETFEHANIQDDLSLHNLALPESFGVTRWANWVLTILALGLGGVVPILLFTCAPFRRLVWALDWPLPPYWSQVVLFAAALIPEIEGRFVRNNVGSELREVTIAVAICVWMATVRR